MLASLKDSREALTNASSASSAGTLFCACAIDAASNRTSAPARRAIIDIERPPCGHDSPSEHPCEAVSDHTAGRVRLQSPPSLQQERRRQAEEEIGRAHV